MVIWGQCSPTLQLKTQGNTFFKTTYAPCDLSTLLKAIRTMAYGLDTSKNKFVVAFLAVTKMFRLKQNVEHSCATYFKNFEAFSSVKEHLGFEMGAEPRLIKSITAEKSLDAIDQLSATDLQTCKTTAMEHFQSILFLYSADQKCFGNLACEPENLQACGKDQYSRTVAEAYNMLAQYKATASGKRATQSMPGIDPSGVFFLQAGASADVLIPDNKGLVFPNMRCYHCSRLWHFSSNFPFNIHPCWMATLLMEDQQPNITFVNNDAGTAGEDSFPPTNTLTSVHMLFLQSHITDNSIPSTWVLLDSQSTMSIFKNPDFLVNISISPSGNLCILTND